MNINLIKILFYFIPFTPLFGYILFIYFNNSNLYYKIISFLLLAFSGLYLLRHRLVVRIPKYFILFIAYIIYVSFWSYVTKLGLTNLLNHLAFIAFIFLINNSYINKNNLNFTIKILQYTLYVALIITLYQVYNPTFFTSDYFRELNMHSSIYTVRRTAIFSFADKDDIGLSFLPILSVLISYSLRNNNQSLWLWVIIGAIISLLTNTRYIIGGYFIIILQIFNYHKLNMKNILRILVILSLIYIIFYQIIIHLGYNFYDFYSQRLFEEGNIENSSRYLAFEAFRTFYKEHWLFGTGVHVTNEIENYLGNKSSQIHVGYLSHLVSYGLIGSLLFFSFLYFLGKELLNNAKKTKYYGAFYSYLIFIWANFSFVQYSLLSYGFMISLIIDKYYLIETLNRRNLKYNQSSKDI